MVKASHSKRAGNLRVDLRLWTYRSAMRKRPDAGGSLQIGNALSVRSRCIGEHRMFPVPRKYVDPDTIQLGLKTEIAVIPNEL
jgi:hypothetical protein